MTGELAGRAAVRTLISLAPGITDRITVSIGIASAPDQAHDRITLLRLADEALYRAKETGRNRVVCIAPEAVPDPAQRETASDVNPSLMGPRTTRRRGRAPAGKAS